MIEPTYFKTNLGENATVFHEEISEYDTFWQKIDVYTSNAIKNAPEPGAVIDTGMKIVNKKKPRFSYPIGKGTSLFLTLRRFAYNAFEGSILKSVNKTKI